MKKKKLVYAVVFLTLTAGIGCGIFVRQKLPKNDVFTDAFFEGVITIRYGLYTNEILGGAAMDPIVSYLKGLRLEPTKDALPQRGNIYNGEHTHDHYIPGHFRYFITYQDKTEVTFDAFEALLEVTKPEGRENYYVIDKKGERVTSFEDTLHGFF